jgi:hypothetical protein
VSDDTRWYQESIAQQAARGLSDLDNRLPIIAAAAFANATTTTGIETSGDQRLTFDNGAANRIYNLDRDKEGATAYISPVEELYLPIWQVRSSVGLLLSPLPLFLFSWTLCVLWEPHGLTTLPALLSSPSLLFFLLLACLLNQHYSVLFWPRLRR